MRRRSRAFGKSGQDSHERWLITYADLITLLMIFFVVMYSMSHVDSTKYESIAITLQDTFRSGEGSLPDGSGILEGAYTRPTETGAMDTNEAGSLDGDEGSPGNQNNSAAVEDSKDESDAVMIGEITEKDLAFRRQEEQLQQVMSTIQQYIQENDLQESITVNDISKGIEIRLSDSLLFALGKADLTSAAMPTLEKLASLFSQLEATISIEGHTDNLAVSPGARYKDNWALSAERALSVLRYFVDEQKLNSEQFQIAGYGDTRPVADNDTEAGRNQNRRVEIIILRSVMAEQ